MRPLAFPLFVRGLKRDGPVPFLLEALVVQRRAATIRGIVQGVGFRPFVHRLATRLALTGFVRNEAGAVRIELEGEPELLETFGEALIAESPQQAQIQDIAWRPIELHGDAAFSIEPSEAACTSDVFVSPDIATCDDCLAELFDPTDRRYRYAFLNCTQCGPRLTIIEGAPYDRERTTMSGFAMCDKCRAEYLNPSDRRFHAQPIACPACGPRLKLVAANGNETQADDPLTAFADALLRGKIGALKGLGGFHLVCDATNEAAVGELRRRKGRDEKPFAVMVADLARARDVCEISDAESRLLRSPQRPIVLLKRHFDEVAPSVAPKNPRLGIMLPYTPLHHLLVCQVNGVPLVMTSGNRSDEPIAYENNDAVRRLGGIADSILTHDRPILVRCDDSVTRTLAGQESPIRRSRGYAPQPIKLPINSNESILAVGGQFKATFGLGKKGMAFLSHHLGDLDHWPAYEAMVRDVRMYEELFRIEPRWIVHDLHPDYPSTRYAQERAAEEELQTLAVQHHHAHIAACLAEHGMTGLAIGVAFDGTGFGIDGAIWGGEFLIADLKSFRRFAHLRYVGLPGGDRAIREPWRAAVAHLIDANCDLSAVEAGTNKPDVAKVGQMIERRINCPLTSSAGRLFDAVAAMIGVRDRVSYEGQAAIELEWLAAECDDGGTYPIEAVQHSAPAGPTIIDTRPLIRAVAADARRGVKKERIARRFHNSLASMIVAICEQMRAETRLGTVALSGGVFMNALLTGATRELLTERGFEVLTHRLAPPNDGGLCLGQLAIAAASIESASDHQERG